MTKYLLVGLLTLLTYCTTDKGKYEDILGREYRDISENKEFDDLKQVAGALVYDSDDLDYTVSNCKKDSLHVLVLERARHDAEGKSLFTAVDILEINGIEKDQRFEFGMCRLNEKSDLQIIALSEYTDTEYLTKIKRAWRVNPEKGKFEEIPTTGVDCVNMSYGAD
jgi:hypothetical protein